MGVGSVRQTVLYSCRTPYSNYKLIEALISGFQNAQWEQSGAQLLLGSERSTNLVMCCDPNKLRQLMNNLISNAVKFTDRGHILVRAEKETIDDKTLWVKLSVVDTGIGIRPEDITLETDGNGIEGEVFVVEPLGRDDMLDVHLGNSHILVLVDPTLRIQAGDKIELNFNAEKVQFFDPETENSLLWT